MDNLSLFRSVCLDPPAHGRRLKEAGNHLLGYMCTYAPEEIITAAGFVPFRLTGNGNPCNLADAHLQSYACSLARECLHSALNGSLSFLEGMVFPHTCDTVQRLSDIWRIDIRMKYHYDIILPVSLAGRSQSMYYTDVLRGFIRDLERDTGRSITDESLRESVELFNTIRSSLSELDELRRNNPDAITGKDFHSVVMASMIMERREYLHELQGLLTETRKIRPRGTLGPGIFITGGVCLFPAIYSMIEEAGGRIAGDDLCTGNRSYSGFTRTDGDIVENIASRYRERIQCPAKHGIPRSESIASMARASGASAVIILALKFCDPHMFDYPATRDRLEAEGFPSLLLEMEGPPSEGMRTRIQAFIERLQG